MLTAESVVPALTYSAVMNQRIFTRAQDLNATKLDQSFPMGLGNLRATLEHIQVGETVWFARWQRKVETPWTASEPDIEVATLLNRLEQTARDRMDWVLELENSDFNATLRYRDSKGGLFETTLRDMIRQGLFHSVHHRAQAVNMLRQVTGEGLEMDYMVFCRRPVEEGVSPV